METIIVTGGAGFIGSNFIIYMLQKYPQLRVVCIDKLTYAASMDNLAPVMGNKHFRFVKADICDRSAVYSVFESEWPSAVVNFAAETHVDRSIASPEIFLDSNITGTSVLMDACLKFKTARFHQISTDEVYGDLPLHGGTPFTELSPIRPSSPYSASKASADLLALAYHRTYGLNVTVSRCSNNYGPRQNAEKLIPLAIANALNGRRIPIYGDGLNVRDWIFVSDHCSAVDAILRDGKPGEIYNVGAQQELPNLTVVQKICAALHAPQSLVVFVPDRKGHDRRYSVNSSKLRSALGWRPKISFSEGIKVTAHWYKRRLGIHRSDAQPVRKDRQIAAAEPPETI